MTHHFFSFSFPCVEEVMDGIRLLLHTTLAFYLLQRIELLILIDYVG